MEADAGRGHCFELYDNKQFSWVSCSCLSTISTNKNITDACPLQGLLVDLRLSVKDSFRSEVNVSDIPIQRLLDRCAEIVKGMNKKPDDTDEGMNSALDVGAIPHENLVPHRTKRDGLYIDEADIQHVLEWLKSMPKTTKTCGYDFAYEPLKDGTESGEFVQVLPERNDEENTQCEAMCEHAEIKRTTPGRNKTKGKKGNGNSSITFQTRAL
ncbi:hypothetical protein N0V87_008240 [Didymella glomerata]|uniref:Uncharacterized protein n=1 Tax=Didymella glomerata TaxID=749621 RepID=A0A9W9BWA8_9PLEO|nr:hypothetical protein N0V87_008240 [Didymella glomerata]